MILFESFGFSKHGHISISATNISWTARHENTKFNPSLMGFFVADVPSFRSIWNDSMHDRTFCALTSRYVKILFKLDNLKPDSTYTGSIEIDEPNEYNLVFGNCQPEVKVTMHVHTEMYNLKDGEKDFLSAGKTPLPKLYFLLFLIYAAFFIVWVIACKNQMPRVEKIHIIMGALLLTKCLKMICASGGHNLCPKNRHTPRLGRCILRVRILQRHHVVHCHHINRYGLVDIETLPPGTRETSPKDRDPVTSPREHRLRRDKRDRPRDEGLDDVEPTVPVDRHSVLLRRVLPDHLVDPEPEGSVETGRKSG
ncbi:hypothetical protein V6N13_014075 [Hibiscus sabdariffa]